MSDPNALSPPREQPRCIFILSIRSCGSSLLQRKLSDLLGARVMEKTPHHENETLYWTKAASALGLPQYRLEKSEVPLPRRRALTMLETMVADNAGGSQLRASDEAAIFEAWTAIVDAVPRTFVEKSPHHLSQPEVVALMERYADQAPFGVRFIGLVRNPTDTLYSSWRRFGIVPEREEVHWIRSYEELLRLKERRPDQVAIVRYEDLVAGVVEIEKLVGIAEPAAENQLGETIHGKSVGRWRGDRRFGYSPSARALEIGRRFGYSDEEMANPLERPWLATRLTRRSVHAVYYRLPSTAQRVLGSFVERF